jgi:ubiquinone/menaquinone biosynthesis C-methylase UbiE
MRNPSEYPAAIARFYDVIYAHLRTVDRDFFLKKILGTKGPVLEIGVGTGRFFLDALNQGADIYGIDVSATMLDQLKKKLDQSHHHRLFHQDARHCISIGDLTLFWRRFVSSHTSSTSKTNFWHWTASMIT